MKTEKGIKTAVKAAGSANKLSGLLGIKRQTVDYWVTTGRPAPEHCQSIKALTGVNLHDLRPDVYPEGI
jgi:DNA-binding transcriptional regulator YdaS (Cro superfamily)